MIEVTECQHSPGQVVAKVRFGDDIKTIRHDVAGAFRTLDYLSQKIRKQYLADANGEQKVSALERHMATLKSLHQELINPLLGVGHD